MEGRESHRSLSNRLSLLMESTIFQGGLQHKWGYGSRIILDDGAKLCYTTGCSWVMPVVLLFWLLYGQGPMRVMARAGSFAWAFILPLI